MMLLLLAAAASSSVQENTVKVIWYEPLRADALSFTAAVQFTFAAGSNGMIRAALKEASGVTVAHSTVTANTQVGHAWVQLSLPSSSISLDGTVYKLLVYSTPSCKDTDGDMICNANWSNKLASVLVESIEVVPDPSGPWVQIDTSGPASAAGTTSITEVGMGETEAYAGMNSVAVIGVIVGLAGLVLLVVITRYVMSRRADLNITGDGQPLSKLPPLNPLEDYGTISDKHYSSAAAMHMPSSSSRMSEGQVVYDNSRCLSERRPPKVQEVYYKTPESKRPTQGFSVYATPVDDPVTPDSKESSKRGFNMLSPLLYDEDDTYASPQDSIRAAASASGTIDSPTSSCDLRKERELQLTAENHALKARIAAIERNAVVEAGNFSSLPPARPVPAAVTRLRASTTSDCGQGHDRSRSSSMASNISFDSSFESCESEVADESETAPLEKLYDEISDPFDLWSSEIEQPSSHSI